MNIRKTLLAAATLLATVGPALADEDIVITKGKLYQKIPDLLAVQLLSVKNNRTTTIGYLGIECAFFHGDELLGTGGERKDNVKAGETVYSEIGSEVSGADRTECRIDYAWGGAH